MIYESSKSTPPVAIIWLKLRFLQSMLLAFTPHRRSRFGTAALKQKQLRMS